MITVAIPRTGSTATWPCRKMPIFFGRVTEPLVGSSSPVRIFINVDLPAPFGQDTAYRRPARKVQVTSSNSTRGPKRMDMLFTESIALHYTVNSLMALNAWCLGTICFCGAVALGVGGTVFRHARQSRALVFIGSGENEKLEEVSSRTFSGGNRPRRPRRPPNFPGLLRSPRNTP